VAIAAVEAVESVESDAQAKASARALLEDIILSITDFKDGKATILRSHRLQQLKLYLTIAAEFAIALPIRGAIAAVGATGSIELESLTLSG
jgi:hypothetical protein